MDYILNVRQAKPSSSTMEEIRECSQRFCERWKNFPAARLMITINHHPRHNDYHVKTTACLPSGREFTGARGQALLPLVHECLDKLDRRIHSFKDRISNNGGFVEGRREREMASLPDVDRLESAVAEGDAARFRQILSVYDEPLGNILKAKIQRTDAFKDDPDLRRLTGLALDLHYLTAFEEYNQRPESLPFRDWLFSLADEVVAELALRPEEVEEEISAFRSSGGSDDR